MIGHPGCQVLIEFIRDGGLLFSGPEIVKYLRLAYYA